MTNFRIVVTSDTVCPWCYVGRRQLQLAERLWSQAHPSSSDTFTVSYEPYQLRPDGPHGPSSSKDKQQAYHARFGPERTAMAQARLTSIGKPLGIDFKYGGQTGSSRDSHRLVRLAKKFGGEAEGKALDGLFATYFEQEGDITSHETLKAVATQAGIPEADFQRAIVDSDEGGDEVDRAANEARMEGVSGVPDFKIQGRYRLSGAQEPAAFMSIFEQVKRAEEAK